MGKSYILLKVILYLKLFLATDNEEVIDMLANENKGIGKAVEKLVYP